MPKRSSSPGQTPQPFLLLVLLFPIGLILTAVSLLQKRDGPTSVGSTQPERSAPKSCSEAISEATTSLSSSGSTVTETRSGEMRPGAVNPFSFNEYLTFSLDGSGNTSSFMSNNDKQRLLAQSILDSCQSTTKVTFGVNGTDYILTWFRMPGNTIQKGVCRDPNINDPYQQLPWGEYVCV